MILAALIVAWLTAATITSILHHQHKTRRTTSFLSHPSTQKKIGT